MSLKTKPIPLPTTNKEHLACDTAIAGRIIMPIERLRIMSADEWADFIFEWVHAKKNDYSRVEQCDGAGDMGRDIIGFASASKEDPWDNFQCKHYNHRLAPSDIWLELGKIIYYTYIEEYSYPRKYVFVAPHGAGNILSKLFHNPDKLKKDLLSLWEKQCQHKITSKKIIELDPRLEKYIASLDFSIFSAISPLTLLEEHRKTPWHIARFGGGLPNRPVVQPPPSRIAAKETNYIRALLDAYEDHQKVTIKSIDDLVDSELGEHFSRSRREFYSAEALREFSRDNIPAGAFEELLNELHDGVIDVVQAIHNDAFARVLATVKQAKQLQLSVVYRQRFL